MNYRKCLKKASLSFEDQDVVLFYVRPRTFASISTIPKHSLLGGLSLTPDGGEGRWAPKGLTRIDYRRPCSLVLFTQSKILNQSAGLCIFPQWTGSSYICPSCQSLGTLASFLFSAWTVPASHKKHAAIRTFKKFLSCIAVSLCEWNDNWVISFLTKE